MVKEVTFRGKTIEELKQLDTREFAKFLKARPRRAVLRQFDKIEKFISRCEKKQAKNKPIKTHLRNLVIVPKMVGLPIQVYNGKQFVTLSTRDGVIKGVSSMLESQEGKLWFGSWNNGVTHTLPFNANWMYGLESGGYENLTISSLTDGTFFWNVTCWDSLDNTNTSTTRNFTVSEPPSISLGNPENNTWSSSNTRTFFFTPSGPLSCGTTETEREYKVF